MEGQYMDDQYSQRDASRQTAQSISRRIHVDDWRCLPLVERDAFVAHVFGDSEARQTEEAPPHYSSDPTDVTRLLAEVAMDGRIAGLALEFDLLPHAWSVFVDVPVCRDMTVHEHTVGDTFCEAVVMALLRVYDVDFITSDDNATGTPGERRAVNALLERVSHVLTDGLPDGWYDDLVLAFGRFRRPQDMASYDLTMWMYAALSRLRTTEFVQAWDEQP